MPFYAAERPQFRVNTGRIGSQGISSSTALEDGGFVLVWGSTIGTARSLKAQRYDSSGAPVGQEFTVATLSNLYQSLFSGSAALHDGGFVVAFENADTTRDGSGSAIQAQRFDSAGQAVGVAFVVNNETVGNQTGASVTTLADGRFVVSWTTAQPAAGGTLSEVKARMFDSTGAPVGPEFLVNTTTTGAQSGSTLTATASGGFIVSWLSGTSNPTMLHGQIFDSSGNKVGGELVLAGAGAGYPTEASVLALPDGRFVVAWRNFPDTGFFDQAIKGQMFDSAGVKIGGEFRINDVGGAQQVGEPQLKALPDGGFVATWAAPSTSFSSGEIMGRRYDSAGAPGASFVINTTYNQSAGAPQTLVTAGGDIVTAWYSRQDFGDSDVSARIFALNKAPTIQSDGGGATAAFTVAEDQLVVTQIVATDRIGPSPVSYAITGGADSALFAIDSTGHLTFIAAPDADAPADHDLDNVYEVVVTASDGELTDSQALSVTVAAAGRGLLVTSNAQVSAAENAVAVTRVTATDAAATFAITGGADAARFTIDPTTGLLSFVSAPNFEAPADSGADNVYDVEVTASAAGQSVAQTLAVTVRNVNEGTAFTTASALTVLENSASVTIAATDTEGDPVAYYISGGADASKFYINATTGVLIFHTAPNYEAPDDAGANRVYDVVIRASDGDIVTTQAFTITIGNVAEGPIISSNGGGATASLSLAENQLVATTVIAGDPPAGTTIVYSISGGSDSSRFTIDATTGVLSFVTAPNYEAPNDSGLNKVYDVIVRAAAGGVSDTQALSIAITNVNEPFSITAFGGGDTGAVSSAENASSATFAFTTDEQDSGTLSITIVGGEDAARFKIHSAFGNTGWISFVTAPNFEAPADANGDNVYYVTVLLSDGTYTDTQTLAVTVTDVNEPVRITSLNGSSSAFVSMAENQTLATTVTAVDPENGAIAYSISGGADAARFSIDSTTGALSFVAAPNFEIRTDNGANNVYDVVVRASDGVTSATQSIAVTVTNVIEPFAITSHGGGDTASLSLAENATSFAVTTSEGGTLTYSIVGGADSARFKVGAVTGGSGTISFLAAPNHEAPTDSNGDNVYQLVVQVSGGGYSDTQTISVTVTNVDEAPVITSFFGGTSASTSVGENGTAVTTVVAADPENAAIIYSISGGADAAKFTINATTGALAFVAAPNFEARTDVGLNNVYDVIVRASDGFLTDTQAIAVTVLNVNEAPSITSNGGGDTASVSVVENSGAVTTVTSTDPENTARTYSIAGGADSAKFTINSSTGALAFLVAPDFDNPADSGANNVYDVIVRASDGTLADTQAIAVTVTNVDEAPVITSNGGGATASLAVGENGLAVAIVVAADPEQAARTYSISGGADAARFAIDPASGVLTFVEAPDFESPADAGGNNVYDVVVRASDGSLADTQAIAITVTNVNEAPAITSGGGGDSFAVSIDENMTVVTTVTSSDPDNTARTYSIAGGADSAKFAIDAATGILSFVAAPDFDNPGDSGADNVYDVIVRASDGTLADTQAIAVTVGGIDEAPLITSNGGGASAWVSATEGHTLVTTVAATDPEGAARLYSIAGGADAALFVIDSETGALSFLEAPDFEAPGDSDGDNFYEVVVEASDGGLTDTQAITVDLGNVNEAVTIVSDGGGVFAVLEVEEDSLAVTQVQASDVDGDAVTYEIAGGADAALFAIDPETGALSFLAAPDFENPADSGFDNVYEVTVLAGDGLCADLQLLLVTVTGT